MNKEQLLLDSHPSNIFSNSMKVSSNAFCTLLYTLSMNGVTQKFLAPDTEVYKEDQLIGFYTAEEETFYYDLNLFDLKS